MCSARKFSDRSESECIVKPNEIASKPPKYLLHDRDRCRQKRRQTPERWLRAYRTMAELTLFQSIPM